MRKEDWLNEMPRRRTLPVREQAQWRDRLRRIFISLVVLREVS